MKRKIGILAIVVILMCFLTINALATENDNGVSQMPFVDSEQISPEHPDIQTEDELIEEFEKMLGEGSGKIFGIALVGVFFSLLFLPALILVIVFAVLNSNTKKKVKEYERFFGPVSGKAPVYYHSNINGMPYGAPFVNPTSTPIETNSENTYFPQNDLNNQQGGQL